MSTTKFFSSNFKNIPFLTSLEMSLLSFAPDICPWYVGFREVSGLRRGKGHDGGIREMICCISSASLECHGGQNEESLRNESGNGVERCIRHAGECPAGREKDPEPRHKEFSRWSQDCGHGGRKTAHLIRLRSD